MSRKTLSPASVFEKVLRAHETGGVTFKDVRAQLKELLAAGASPTDLLETLRRQEEWEPLPESARVEVVGLIDEAIRTAPKNDDSEAASPTVSDSISPPSTGAAAASGSERGEPDLPLDSPGPAANPLQSARMRRPASSDNIRSLEARIAGQQADYTSLTRSYERAREAESAANGRASALATQVKALEAARDADHAKAQQDAVTLAETVAANEALHSRAEAAVQEARDARSELRELGESLQARHATFAAAQQALGAGAAELAALQQKAAQAAKLLAAEQARSQHAAQAIAELQHAARQQDAALTAIQVEHAKVIPVRDAEVSELRRSLTARDTALEAMQSDLRTASSALAEAQKSASEREARRETELQSVHAALVAEQKKGQLDTQAAKQSQEDLRAAREALSAELQAARSALAEAQRSVSEREAGLESESHAVRAALVAEQKKSQLDTLAAKQSQEDLSAVREALSARNASLAEAQRALGTRDAGIEALQSELQAARSALAEAQKSVSEREARRETELQSVRAALVAEQKKSQLDTQGAKQSQEDLRAVREALSARDASLAEAQRVIGTRNAGIDALQSELHTARSALAEAQRSVSEREAGLESESHAVRAALVVEQGKNQHAVQSAEQLHDDVRVLRDSLAARDAALAEAHRSLGNRAAGLEALQSDLHAARSALAAAQRSVSEHEALHKERTAERPSLTADPVKLKAAGNTHQVERAPLPAPKPIPVIASAMPLRVEPRIGTARGANRNRLGIVMGVLVLCAVAVYFLTHRTQRAASVAVNVAAALPKSGTVIRDCLTCPEITVLPTGSFSQGSAGPGVGPAAFEKPLHDVTISRVTGMATNLVTVDEFQQFVMATGWQSQGCTTYDGDWKARPKNNWSNPGFAQTGKHPVTCASWNDAQAYARWLSAKAGHTYRLPSASEWEYAARAGGEAVVPWTAESAACANANVADNSAARRYPGWASFNCDDGYVYTSPVGSFKANGFGLNDMLGNVFQWTADCWHPDYVGAPSDGTARTDGPCDEHELRGGSWFTTPAYVRANYRNHFTADYRSSTVGIRLVRDFGA